MIKRFALAAICCVWAISCYAQTTAVRPAQIVPGTPDTTVGIVGNNLAIGSTVSWRSDATMTPTFASTDNAKIVELTNSGAITATVPDATTANGFGAGSAFTIQVGPGTLTLNRQTSSTINGLNTIKVGSYQQVTLYSQNLNWYAVLSVPQPAAQTGSTSLVDNMTWPGGAGCTAATNFLSRANTAGPALDTTHTNAYTSLICGLAADNVWSLLDALWIPATVDTARANLNLVAAAYTLAPTTGANAPGFIPNQGYTGGAEGNTTVYIDTGYNGSTAGGQYTLNLAHLMTYTLISYKSTGYAETIGAAGPTYSNAIVPYNTSGNVIADVNYANTATSATATVTDSKGSTIASRSGASSSAIYRNGTALTLLQSAAASGVPNANVYLLASSKSGSAPVGGGPYQVSAASIGGALSAALAGALHTRICNYLTAVNGSC